MKQNTKQLSLDQVIHLTQLYERIKTYEIINTRQGYTNCSIAVIDDNSAIVTDKGLYKILQKHQITPLLYSVKKSLFLTFYHISVIFDRSIIFIIFLHLPKITIFHLFYKITKNHHFPINDHFPGNTKNTQIC